MTAVWLLWRTQDHSELGQVKSVLLQDATCEGTQCVLNKIILPTGLLLQGWICAICVNCWVFALGAPHRHQVCACLGLQPLGAPHCHQVCACLGLLLTSACPSSMVQFHLGTLPSHFS